MKVLICKRVGGAFGYITDGMINALVDVGHEVRRYDDKLWQHFNPDLYIGCSGHQQFIPNKSQRGFTKVAIHVNPYGPIDVKPNINEPNSVVSWVKQQEPDVVFGYGHETDRNLWSYWDSTGIKWVPLATAGDATLYYPNFDDYENRDLDFVYVGGRWEYKAKNIDTWLFPLLWKDGLKYELWGWGEWPNHVCSGQIGDKEKHRLFRRAKMCPCVSEPHTLQCGIDVPERIFKVILSGAIAVHDAAFGIKRYVPSIVVAPTANELVSKVEELIAMPVSQRLILAKQQYLEVAKEHTYHHRMATLFDALGFMEEASDLLVAAEKYEHAI
jgi:hypothetical protein